MILNNKDRKKDDDNKDGENKVHGSVKISFDYMRILDSVKRQNESDAKNGTRIPRTRRIYTDGITEQKRINAKSPRRKDALGAFEARVGAEHAQHLCISLQL